MQSSLKALRRRIITGFILRFIQRKRALCDACQVDPDGPIFLKAFKRYAKAGAVDADAITTFDKLLKTNVLRFVMHELADG
jgi:hypothetical protein